MYVVQSKLHIVLGLMGIQCTHASQNTRAETVVTASHLRNEHGASGYVTPSHCVMSMAHVHMQIKAVCITGQGIPQ